MEADALMSSPSKVSDDFLPSANKDYEYDDEDLEETPITRKITVKAKAKEVVQVVGKERQVKMAIMGAKQTTMEKKTKEVLL